jgi:hypothetical protein
VEGDQVALVSGVNDGEKVIVEGQMRLVDGARVTDGIASKSTPQSSTPQPSAPPASDKPRPAATEAPQ